MPPTKPTVRATQIGEYIRHHSCERRFKLAYNDYELAGRLPFYFQLSSTIDPVLSAAGRRREAEWETLVRAAGLADLCRYDQRPGAKHTAWEEFAAAATELSAGTDAYGREIKIEGELGAFRVTGQIDFLLLLWDPARRRYRLRLVECKASRKDRTYHRIQLTLYYLLLRELLTAQPLLIDGIVVGPEDLECVVARVDEATEQVDNVLLLPPLDLTVETEDLRYLLAPGGRLEAVLGLELDELPYQLDSGCDDCSLATHCMAESARKRRIQLLGVDASTVRAFQEVGLRTLDHVAELDPSGPVAAQLRLDPRFSGELHALVRQARARRGTLPGGDMDPVDPEVLALPHSPASQLPAHVVGGERLVRIYLSVSYDYAENRIGALAAHVTRSDWRLSTVLPEGPDGRLVPNPDVKEQLKEQGPDGISWHERPVQGTEVVAIQPAPWTGDYAADTTAEGELLERFFAGLIDALRSHCPSGQAPVHLYVWSRAEISRLMEACARCGGEPLFHLRELLGCRAPLEQLIYSVLGDEVDSRYALGWTGRGLIVATSLKWYGWRFHWRRRVAGEVVALDNIFRQDLFDFKTTLRFDGGHPERPWRALNDAAAARHSFEVRACFQDALPAPYWRAYWGTLPDPDAPGQEPLDPKVRAALRRYRAAGGPALLPAYLAARVQALRWVEESIQFKNEGIPKPPLRIDHLAQFTLGVDSTARAALDFLQLEAHVKANDWLAGNLRPVVQRVATGRTLPLRDLRPVDGNVLEARIDGTACGLGLAALAVRCSWEAGAFVRVSPAPEDPTRGQTVKQLMAGSTCVIEALDWQRGVVRLSVRPYNMADRYILRSIPWRVDRDPYPSATADESPSDFVSGRVDGRLQGTRSHPAYRWLDPTGAQIPPQAPLSPELKGQLEQMLAGFDPGPGVLAPDQRLAVLEGLEARLQLLLGPPGTGKTQTTAAAVLARILARRRPGDVVLLSGNTNMAVDTLLERILRLLPRFAAHVAACGMPFPPVQLVRVHSSGTPAPGADIIHVPADRSGVVVSDLRRESVVIIGGTPSALLKAAGKLTRPIPHLGPALPAPVLVVDEASMLVFPVFLALATLIREDGEVLLAGDHRQLAPIVGHDWEHEDRPPAQLYQPYVSAYVAMDRLKQGQGVPDDQITRSALRYTFRLPAQIRELLARLYAQDGVHLEGRAAEGAKSDGAAEPGNAWERLWAGDTGLFLVTHSERASKGSNVTEAALIQEILAAGARCGKLAPASIGIVTPHRAQRSLLKATLADFDEAVDVLDTVERLQGGERDTIIVSATCSDPSAIQARADFLLSLNRANVAFSRAKRRLIVVCGETLLAHIPPELEHYQAAALWKGLRAVCSQPVAQVPLGNLSASLYTVP